MEGSVEAWESICKHQTPRHGLHDFDHACVGHSGEDKLDNEEDITCVTVLEDPDQCEKLAQSVIESVKMDAEREGDDVTTSDFMKETCLIMGKQVSDE